MSFSIDIKTLRDRASKRVATAATSATLLPATGSKVATVARVAEVPARDRRPFRLSTADADRCHAGAWGDAEIATFSARVMLFIRRGVNPTDADDLAERLTLRDRDGDDMVMCVECRHGPARTCPGGTPLPVGVLSRCEGFDRGSL